MLGLAGEALAQEPESWVATPTGQVLRWHLRIMMQPAAINGAVAKPNSSAPAARRSRRHAGAEAAVDLDHDAAAQPLADQRLMGLGKADLPRRAGVLDRGQRRSAGAALEARDGDMVGARLGDARGDRADADLGDQLDRDVARRVDVLEVVDELRQILDRVDVVMRRRRDQADARRRVPYLGDGCIDLVAGQLAASPGLAPCAILICIMSELTRYSVVTPKRPEATCLMPSAWNRRSASA